MTLAFAPNFLFSAPSVCLCYLGDEFFLFPAPSVSRSLFDLLIYAMAPLLRFSSLPASQSISPSPQSPSRCYPRARHRLRVRAATLSVRDLAGPARALLPKPARP